MSATNRPRRRTKKAVIALGSIAFAGFGIGFTASNTVPASKAGDGSGVISGYVVSTVHYTLNATDPSKIDQVSFTLDTAPGASATTKVQVVSGGSWFSCTVSGTAATCATTGSGQPTVAAADNLRVIVAQ